MSHPNIPPIITQIEKILDHPLHPAPDRNNDPLGGLMPYKENTPKYALHGTTLIGLNLAKTGLSDEKWQQITQLPDFPNQDIRGLSLSENQLTEFRLLPGMANLERLYIDENPLTFPDEAITKQGNAAILRFLKEIFI
ncbi:MAG: hypothetical protein KDD99_30895, partial [Bacteroidetes bacterium]|nr:hypothetical protein [Bacteroidota bacterium]